MLMESSMVIRRDAAFSAASLKIGHPPIRTPTTPITLTLGIGSHRCNQTEVAASATNAIRVASSGLRISSFIGVGPGYFRYA
jgi:hypothetical protein